MLCERMGEVASYGLLISNRAILGATEVSRDQCCVYKRQAEIQFPLADANTPGLF
jgi:hypothetical protein